MLFALQHVDVALNSTGYFFEVVYKKTLFPEIESLHQKWGINSNAVTLHPPAMTTLTIRNLPDDVREKLRLRAAQKGRSTEAEVQSLLTEAVAEEGDAPRPTVRERVERLQAAFAPYRSAEGSIVDELIAERRIEGWTEDLEALQDMNAGKKLDLSRFLRK